MHSLYVQMLYGVVDDSLLHQAKILELKGKSGLVKIYNQA
jgi:hypothetical protein